MLRHNEHEAISRTDNGKGPTDIRTRSRIVRHVTNPDTRAHPHHTKQDAQQIPTPSVDGICSDKHHARNAAAATQKWGARYSVCNLQKYAEYAISAFL